MFQVINPAPSSDHVLAEEEAVTGGELLHRLKYIVLLCTLCITEREAETISQFWNC